MQTLAERTAALGREGVGVWQAGDDVCLKTCQELAEQGYLDVDVDEFLDAVYKPNWSRCNWESFPIVSNPFHIFAFLRDVRKYKDLSKIELMCILLSREWSPATVAKSIEPGKLREFQTDHLVRSIDYWLAMVQIEDIHAKGVLCVAHSKPQFYFKCLLHLESEMLEQMVALENTRVLTTEDYKQFLRGLGSGLLALEDEELQALEDGDDVPEAAFLPALIADRSIVPVLRPRNLKTAAFNVKVAGGSQVHIHLDGASHTARTRELGRQRAYVTCCGRGHTSCHKYGWLHHFNGNRECFAFLYLWLTTPEQFANRQSHYGFFLCERQVREVAARIRIVPA